MLWRSITAQGLYGLAGTVTGGRLRIHLLRHNVEEPVDHLSVRQHVVARQIGDGLVMLSVAPARGLAQMMKTVSPGFIE